MISIIKLKSFFFSNCYPEINDKTYINPRNIYFIHISNMKKKIKQYK